MHGVVGQSGRRAALVMALLGCGLIGSHGAPASDGVYWQGSTPEPLTAYAAGVGHELAITLEASGPIGSSPQIFAEPLPRGARLERVSDAPAKVVFRWRPTEKQIGEWKLACATGERVPDRLPTASADA